MAGTRTHPGAPTTLLAALLVLCGLSAGVARGEVPVAPPILLGSVQVPLPAGALHPGDDVRTAVVSLVVDEDGRVLDAEILDSSGSGPLDDAALDACAALEFFPARTADGEAVLVTIDFPVRFLPPRPQPPLPSPATVQGRVLMMGTRGPLPGTRIEAAPAEPEPAVLSDGAEPALPDASSRTAETDDDGRFTLSLPAGSWVLSFSEGEGLPTTSQVVLAAGEQHDLVVRLFPAPSGESRVVASASTGETVRTLDADAVRRTPGAGNDPLRAASGSPGVAHTPNRERGGANVIDQLPVIRGAAPTDSVGVIEGLPTPFVRHSSSDQAIVGDYFLDRVFLLPAAAPARYGDHVGGVLGYSLRSPRSDRFGGFVQPGVTESSIALEGPLSANARLAAGFERDYLHWIFAALYPKGSAVRWPVVPYHQNQQVLLELDPSPALGLRVSYLGSRDGLAIDLGEDADGDRERFFERSTRFDRVTVSARMGTSGAPVRNELRAALTFWGRRWEFVPADIGYDESHVTLHALDELVLRPAPFLDVRVGGLLEVDNLVWQANESQGARENTGPQQDLRVAGLKEGAHRATDAWVGGWASASLRPLERLTLTPEVRVDWFEGLDAVEVQPRVRIHAQPTDGIGVRLAGGRFAQHPGLEDTNPITGNPELDPEGAWHLDGGVNLRPVPQIELDVGGYVRWMDRLAVTSLGEASFGDLASPTRSDDPTHGFSNDGRGRAFGGEVRLRLETPTVDWGLSGEVSYSLGWSQRRDGDGDWRPFSQDRRHMLAVTAGVRLPGDFRVGARFRLQSGAPTTPVLGSVWFADQGRSIPVFGEPWSAREALFHRLDLRVEKVIRDNDVVITVFMDVANVYDARDAALAVWDHDWSESAAISFGPEFNAGTRIDF